jgi:hypothetical protein
LIFLDYFAQIYIFKILIVSIAATVPILFNWENRKKMTHSRQDIN